jgi:hypothetical protein
MGRTTPQQRPNPAQGSFQLGADVWRSNLGVSYDYFSAPSDEVAATAINRIGGPGVPSEDTPPLPAFDTFQTKGIDPVVMLGKLEALLTSRDYEEIVHRPRACKLLAIDDDGALLVQTLADELQTVLADADGERLAAVALPWSQIKEFWSHADPDQLASWLGEFAELARRARSRGERLYCWSCI